MYVRKNRIGATIAVLFAVVGLVLGFFVSQTMHRQPQIDATKFHGTWLDKPREVSKFDLMGTDSVSFNNASLHGHWTMMFFGFTSCSSICPTTMAELGKMARLLEEQGITPLPKVALVSLDPDRDSLETLKQYVTAFNPHFIGARGEGEDGVKALAQEIGLAYTRVALSDNSQSYTIDHSGTVMLFNPEGKLCAFFTMPHQAKQLAEDYRLATSF